MYIIERRVNAIKIFVQILQNFDFRLIGRGSFFRTPSFHFRGIFLVLLWDFSGSFVGFFWLFCGIFLVIFANRTELLRVSRDP